MSRKHGARLSIFADPMEVSEAPGPESPCRPEPSQLARERAKQLLATALSPGHQKHRGQFVYFIANSSGTAIKIGTACDVPSRLCDLQVGNHEELFVVATLTGNETTERVIQTHFDASFIRGEWYKPAEDLLEFIRILRESQESSLDS